MDLTTDLKSVRAVPTLFCWGRVEVFHDVGRYTIVEYSNATDQTVRHFHVYVDGKSTNNSCSSLEKALIFAVAFGGGQEINTASHMAMAAVRLLLPETE